jgi:EAL domain-containing protein (putative c-di-GMP-specific phosphodiesterase class I)
MDVEAIEQGLANGEFYLEYLPIVDLADGSCVGAEALTRWRRPDGVVMPDEFMPFIHNTPWAGRLTYWVIDTVAAELLDWLHSDPSVYICINVPPEVLGRGGIMYAAERSGLAGFTRQIVLEITERGVPDLLGMQGLDAARGLGVRLALDDVSMSGVNLAILTRIPFEIVKIHQNQVAQIVPGSPLPEWLLGIAALLKTTALQVVAEGVETEFQAATLRESGIHLVQGFHFAPPMPVHELEAFHAKRRVTGFGVRS